MKPVNTYLLQIFAILLLNFSCSNPDTNKKIVLTGNKTDQPDLKGEFSVLSENGYCYYVPESVTSENATLVFLFDPHGNGDFPVKKYMKLAEQKKLILAGSMMSKNGLSIQTIQSETLKSLDKLKQQMPVSINSILFAGFSGGGRVAAELGNHISEVNGFISCGAANSIYPSGNKKMALVCGQYDFNYIECQQVAQKRTSNSKVANFVFEGKHEWPTDEAFSKALDFVINGNLSTSSYVPNDNEEQSFKHELAERQMLARSFTNQSEEWWTNKLENYRIAAKGNNKIEKAVAHRLLAYVGILSYTFCNRSLQAGNLMLLEHCLFIYETVEPKNPDMLYFQACNSALRNQKSDAMAFLELAVENGMEKSQIAHSDYLRILRIEDRFQELVAN